MWHEELYSVWHNIWESLRTRAWIPGLDQSTTSSVRADRCIFQTKPDVTCFAPSWLPLLHWAGPITTAAHRLRLVCPLRCLLISLSLQICFLAVGFWWESCHCCRPGNNNGLIWDVTVLTHKLRHLRLNEGQKNHKTNQVCLWCRWPLHVCSLCHARSKTLLQYLLEWNRISLFLACRAGLSSELFFKTCAKGRQTTMTLFKPDFRDINKNK